MFETLFNIYYVTEKELIINFALYEQLLITFINITISSINKKNIC